MDIWQAYGPNQSDFGYYGPNLGIFEGERDTVIDWVEAHHPGFRNQLKEGKGPKAHLLKLSTKVITRELLNDYFNALAAKKAIEETIAKFNANSHNSA